MAWRPDRVTALWLAPSGRRAQRHRQPVFRQVNQLHDEFSFKLQLLGTNELNAMR